MAFYDVLKDAAKLALDLKRMDLYQEILKVTEEVADLKKENLELRESIQSLQERLNLKDSLEFAEGIYWIRKDPMTANQVDTPVCPKCFDRDGKVVRLAIDDYAVGRGIHCKYCKEVHVIKKRNKPDPPGRQIVL